MTISAITAIVLVLTGLGIGLLSGLLGVGGGTIMVPVFSLGFGMGAVTATGTSLFTIIPTSISGIIGHLRQRTADWRVGLAMGLGGACASPLGVRLAQDSPEWLVLCAVAAVIAYSATTMLCKALKKPAGASQPGPDGSLSTKGGLDATRSTETATPAETAAGTSDPFTRPTFDKALFAKSVLIGVTAGLAGGYVGLGGGFIMIPLMSTLLHFPMRLASGTSLIGIICIAIPGAITQGVYGNVDIAVGLLVACGSIPGALLGTRLARRFNDRTLRLMFAALLGVAAIMMVVKQFA